ncbi:hypothetical protein FOZ60_015521 [Perkinsus olseni]|uniref:Peptidase C1A papain C-terminal domain-containing protein n=1 Tax=Perkinsus olseni TaxID=32597 RepID=A0A7J6N5A5_PEROL|nr:hypothetical protein FOZ60_015521 [Perkinsus olseni]
MNGLVTGDDFTPSVFMDEYAGCWPYDFRPCNHLLGGANYRACPEVMYKTPSCATSCPNDKYRTPFKEDRHSTDDLNPTQFYSTDSIKKEIMTNGPVSAAFDVYADFPTYKHGVYKHTCGEYLGGHAVKILGWGNYQGEDYWLVMNSWNKNWGDHGFFKIANKDSGINNLVLGAAARLR